MFHIWGISNIPTNRQDKHILRVFTFLYYNYSLLNLL